MTSTMFVIPAIGGRGVLVEESAMPYFMIAQTHGLSAGLCANSEIEAALVKNPSRLEDNFVLRFAGNKIYKMGHMNPEIGSALCGKELGC